jgi:GNAT superfamily N-acetyltransferase
MEAITLRRLSASDSLDELTALLHRAFSRLGQMGLNCTCVDQAVMVTRERIEKGECYVAVYDARLVGTITLYRPDPGSESIWYRRRTVASIHQLGVDPEYQGKGLGTALLDFAEGWARARGYRELALDTAQLARHLLAFYLGHGYRIVESVRFSDKHYCSVVLSKVVAKAHFSYPVASHLLHATAMRVGSRAGQCVLEWMRVTRCSPLKSVRFLPPVMRQARRLTHPLRPRC